MKYYITKQNEVFELGKEEVEEIVLQELGLTIEPQGKDGTYTETQMLFLNWTIENFTEDFLDGPYSFQDI